MELLAQKRALDLFKLKPEEWGVNVQSLSGAPANFNVYNAFLEYGDKAMGLRLACGGVDSQASLPWLFAAEQKGARFKPVFQLGALRVRR